MNTPGRLAWSHIATGFPGVASILRASWGTQKLWITSADSTRTSSAVPAGI